VGEQPDERGEKPVGDVPRDVASSKAEDGGCDEPDEREQDGGNERLSQRTSILPSPFVADRLARLAHGGRVAGRALDVATGRGRHLPLLARAGFRTFGVDIRLDALTQARAAAAGADVRGIDVRLWCADLTRHPLPVQFFDVIVVTRYLQRDLFDAIAEALAPGGVLIYETFTTAQLALGTGPRSPEHLLRPNELRTAFPSLAVESYEEVTEPEALARLAARRPR